MKKLLPFKLESPFSAYQYSSYFSGILLADNDKNKFNWLLSYSLRVKATEASFYVNFPGDCPILFKEIYNTPKDCFDRYQIDLPHHYIDDNRDNIIIIIKNMLCEGLYVHGYFDEFYIKCRSSYLKVHFIHDYLIIGFDDIEQIFYLVGYTEKMIYKITSISFEEYINAVVNRSDHHSNSFNFIKINENFQFKFSEDMAKRSLKEFVNSTDYSIYRTDDEIYGKSALLKFCSNNFMFYSVQNIVALGEHFFFFSELLKYLLQIQYLENNRILTESITNQKNILILKHLIIKYYFAKDEKILLKVNDIIKKAVECEIVIIENLILRLESI